MAAIAYPQPYGRPSRPQLRVLEPARHRPSRRAVYRRRRVLAVAAVVLFVFALQLAVQIVTAWLGGGPLTASEPRAATAAAGAVHVVQPGDTLWTLARRAQPTGDVRPLVGRLAAAQDGRPLRPGQRIVLP
jgi:hypothetical protein